jgi:hypothetical protein
MTEWSEGEWPLMARDDNDGRMFCLATGILGCADCTATFHNFLLLMTWLDLSAISQSTEFVSRHFQRMGSSTT